MSEKTFFKFFNLVTWFGSDPRPTSHRDGFWLVSLTCYPLLPLPNKKWKYCLHTWASVAM